MSTALNLTGQLLMPKASAVWLIDNTTLSFKQIAEFTALTEIEIEALADGDIGRGLVGRNPIENHELTQEELERCQADNTASLKVAKSSLPPVKSRAKGPRYTPVSKRGDKPDAIAFIIKNHTEITDAQIGKLVGTTKPTITAVRERTHPNTPNLRPRHPAELGLCTWQEYEKVYDKALRAAGKDPEEIRAQKLADQQASLSQPEEDDIAAGGTGGFDFSNFLGDAGTSSSED